MKKVTFTSYNNQYLWSSHKVFNPCYKYWFLYFFTFILYRKLSLVTKLLTYQLHSLCLIRYSIVISTPTVIASNYIRNLHSTTESPSFTIHHIFLNYKVVQISSYIFNIPKYSPTYISLFLDKLPYN